LKNPLLNIALDVDGVLAASTMRWLGYYNKTNNKTLKYQEITRFDLGSITGLHNDEILKIFSAIWEDYRSMPVMERNLADTTQKMRKFGRITIVTARTPDTVDAVEAWLKLKGIVYDEYRPVIIGMAHHPNPKESLNKEYDVFIDDNAALADGKRTLILRSQPWNQEVIASPPVYRVGSVKEALPILAGGV
jgi:5'(3')-deoxyribonucleotidase